jgi:WYL_2, Sm-like SH3 beta-barrel fold
MALVKYEKQALINDLKQSVVEVTFIKVNGERRVMRCTLDPRYIPVTVDQEHLDEQHARKENENVIAAWDVHNGGWRSFRINSIEFVQEIDGY